MVASTILLVMVVTGEETYMTSKAKTSNKSLNAMIFWNNQCDFPSVDLLVDFDQDGIVEEEERSEMKKRLRGLFDSDASGSLDIDEIQQVGQASSRHCRRTCLLTTHT